MLDCHITVNGSKSRLGLTGPRGSAGNTTRPWLDTTRPVKKFFRGMSSYSSAIARHILSCEKCDPNAALKKIGFKTASNFRGERLVNVLLKDPRTDKRAARRALLRYKGMGAILGIARTAKPAELLQEIRSAIKGNEIRKRTAGFPGPSEAVWAEKIGLDAQGFFVGIKHHSHRRRQDGVPRLAPGNRNVLTDAATLIRAKIALPRTVEALKKAASEARLVGDVHIP